MRPTDLIRVALVSALATGCPADDDDTDVPLPSQLGLQQVDAGYVAPLAIVHDGVGEHFVVDQIGTVHRLGEADPWLDIRDRMVELNPGFDERGLIGLAFDPDHGTNGWLYAYYSAPLRDGAPEDWNHTGHISRFTVDAQGQPDPGSEVVLLQVDQPQGNHNGGALVFGPDGMLYIALGDGGGAHDLGVGHPPQGNGQDVTTLLGSILRIDVSDGTVRIPEDNPFATEGPGQPEIWAWGLRNPFKMSFDRQTGDLIAADVGQWLYEEVNLIEGGNNYGWNIKEGTICFDPDNPEVPAEQCPDQGSMGEPLIDPVVEYQNVRLLGPAPDGVYGTAIIGGFVYRGTALVGHEGRYIFGDFTLDADDIQGAIFVADPSDNWSRSRVPMPELEGLSLRGFGESPDGELFVAAAPGRGVSGRGGVIFRIVPRD